MLLLELDMRGCRVFADTHHLVACTLQFSIVVAQAARLSRTPAGIVLGIEVQHQLTSTIVTQTDIPSLLVLAQYLRRLVSNVHSRYNIDDVAKIRISGETNKKAPQFFSAALLL